MKQILVLCAMIILGLGLGGLVMQFEGTLDTKQDQVIERIDEELVVGSSWENEYSEVC